MKRSSRGVSAPCHVKPRLEESARARPAALALYFVHYNFGRSYKTLGVTPAMDDGKAVTVGSFDDIANLGPLKSAEGCGGREQMSTCAAIGAITSASSRLLNEQPPLWQSRNWKTTAPAVPSRETELPAAA